MRCGAEEGGLGTLAVKGEQLDLTILKISLNQMILWFSVILWFTSSIFKTGLLYIYSGDLFTDASVYVLQGEQLNWKLIYIVCRMKARRKPVIEMIVTRRHMRLKEMKWIGQ